MLTVNLDIFNNWVSKFRERPSEVLCIIEESIGISRISFPNQDHKDGKKTNEQLISIEYIANLDYLEATIIENIIENLSRIFKFGKSLKLVDKKFLRPLFINSPDDYDKAAKEIRKLLLNTDLEVPFIYLWPVNMAKCGFAAAEAYKKIKRDLIINRS